MMGKQIREIERLANGGGGAGALDQRTGCAVVPVISDKNNVRVVSI